MTEGGLESNLIGIPSALTAARDYVCFFKVHDDSLHRPFCDPNKLRDVSKPDVWITIKADQHVRVVREKGPRAAGGGLGLVHRGLLIVTGSPLTPYYTKYYSRKS